VGPTLQAAPLSPLEDHAPEDRYTDVCLFVESGGEELGATGLAKGPTTQTLSLDPLDAGQYIVFESHPRTMKGTLAVVDAGG
jgi:hypothetical protein